MAKQKTESKLKEWNSKVKSLEAKGEMFYKKSLKFPDASKKAEYLSDKSADLYSNAMLYRDSINNATKGRDIPLPSSDKLF